MDRNLPAVGLVLIVCAVAAAHADSILPNGNCEQAAEGKPVGWCTYDGVDQWGSLADGYRGKAVYFVPKPFSPIATGARAGEDYQSCGLMCGSSNSYTGSDALTSSPPPAARYCRHPGAATPFYRLTCWIKSSASEMQVSIQCWATAEARARDRLRRVPVVKLPATEEWTHCERVVRLPASTKRFAPMFQVHGYRRDGLRLGRVCIDEVTISRTRGQMMTADDLPRIEIPDRPTLYAGDTPLDEILADYRAGKESAVARVRGMLAAADKLAANPDEWFRQFYRDFEPRGVYTVTCPIHPFKTRYYNDFSWSLAEPWKLICEHCKTEGRQYCHYPNPDYPDDGNGCAPTDEVWSRTHDKAWSRAHDNIPHDHWDGSTHGDSGGGRRFYFLGKYYVNAILDLQGKPVRTFALGWHCAAKLFPAGSKEHARAEVYAHKAKVILLCTARAYLGDDYLAAAEGLTPQQFRARLESFYQPSGDGRWKYEKLTGFRPFNWTDATVGDPLYKDVVAKRPFHCYGPFIGAWNWRAAQARTLLEGACMLREAFPDSENDLRRICQRAAISVPGDRERVAMGKDPVAFYLKRGCVEMELQPYSMVAAGDNLAGSTLLPVLRMGLMLRDDRIIENVARDIYYFWRNQFSQDGLGAEGSPTYSPYGITRLMKMLHGMTGDFDPDAPYCDKELGGLNLFKLPVYKACAAKMMYYATEDDYYIPWEDSVYDRGRRGVEQYELMERYGGGIPEKERQLLHVRKADTGKVSVSFDRDASLPPLLLHDRRKAILRSGRPKAPTVVSLNFTKACGHLHNAVQDLVLHACGQELASDLGYLGSDHFLRPWLKSHPAHNCLCLRRADGSPDGATRVRGDLRRHFVVTPHCQLVDTAEYDAADWAAFGSAETGELSRQVLLMAPSQQHQYVIDIARGKGGTTHDYYFHCHGLKFDTDGIDLRQADDPDQTLYDYSGWTFDCSKYRGARSIRALAAGKARGPWRATWSRIDDYRGRQPGNPKVHDEVFLRLWMLDEPGSEVIAGDAPAQRHFKNEDIGRKMKVVCVRRPNRASVNNFVAVMEPYAKTPFVKSVRRLDPGVDDQYTAALAVETIYGVDYVIARGGPGEPSQVALSDGNRTIATDADVAVVSHLNSGHTNLLLAGGTYLRADSHELELQGPARFTGRLLDFDDARKTLTVESADSFPPGRTMAGQPIIVQHSEDRSSFTIASVQALSNGRYVVSLDDQPHLCNNWLLVKNVTEEGIVVEPPPILDRKRRTFKVYAGEPDNLRLLGPLRQIGSTTIRNEFGTAMHTIRTVVTDDYTAVRPGQEIALTRLEKGRDTVSVTNFACLTAGP